MTVERGLLAPSGREYIIIQENGHNSTIRDKAKEVKTKETATGIKIRCYSTTTSKDCLGILPLITTTCPYPSTVFQTFSEQFRIG